MNKSKATLRRYLSLAVMAAKLLPGSACVLWGGIIGILGVGPDGFVPLNWRLTGLCFFVGGVGASYPFSVASRRGPANWLIVGCTTAPLFAWIIAMINNPEAWTPKLELGAIIPIAIMLSLPLFSSVELLLSGKFRPRHQSKEITTDSG